MLDCVVGKLKEYKVCASSRSSNVGLEAGVTEFDVKGRNWPTSV